MITPTIREALDHLAEFYGLTRSQAQALVRTPLHPHGMRDDFAGQALQGLLAGGAENIYPDRDLGVRMYAIADAALEARLPKEKS